MKSRLKNLRLRDKLYSLIALVIIIFLLVGIGFRIKGYYNIFKNPPNNETSVHDGINSNSNKQSQIKANDKNRNRSSNNSDNVQNTKINHSPSNNFSPGTCFEPEKNARTAESVYLESINSYIGSIGAEIDSRYSADTDTYSDIKTVNKIIKDNNKVLDSKYSQVQDTYKLQKKSGCSYKIHIKKYRFPKASNYPKSWQQDAYNAISYY